MVHKFPTDKVTFIITNAEGQIVDRAIVTQKEANFMVTQASLIYETVPGIRITVTDAVMVKDQSKGIQ